MVSIDPYTDMYTSVSSVVNNTDVSFSTTGVLSTTTISEVNPSEEDDSSWWHLINLVGKLASYKLSR